MPGQARLSDKCQGACVHGCPAEPHVVIGTATSGSSDVLINGRPALRMNDGGTHAACCGPNTWNPGKGSATVMINGQPAIRMGDMTRHCGGVGQMTSGSTDVMTGG